MGDGRSKAGEVGEGARSINGGDMGQGTGGLREQLGDEHRGRRRRRGGGEDDCEAKGKRGPGDKERDIGYRV
eukprot:7621504-Pyramimonas_sp.AAC.1